MVPLHIAIAGAPGTGKSALAQALVSKLNLSNDVLRLTVIDSTLILDTLHTVNLTLLTSIDTDDPVSKRIHQQLRTEFATRNLAYAVIYGDGQARTKSALDAIAHHLKRPPARSSHDTVWRWACETCADAECEHKLFSQLL
jgi:adenylate kinase family enzyme